MVSSIKSAGDGLVSGSTSQTGTALDPERMLSSAERKAWQVRALLEEVRLGDHAAHNRLGWLLGLALELARTLRGELDELFTWVPDNARKVLGPRLAALLSCSGDLWAPLEPSDEEAQTALIVLELAHETSTALSELLSRTTTRDAEPGALQ